MVSAHENPTEAIALKDVRAVCFVSLLPRRILTPPFFLTMGWSNGGKGYYRNNFRGDGNNNNGNWKTIDPDNVGDGKSEWNKYRLRSCRLLNHVMDEAGCG